MLAGSTGPVWQLVQRSETLLLARLGLAGLDLRLRGRDGMGWDRKGYGEQGWGVVFRF